MCVCCVHVYNHVGMHLPVCIHVEARGWCWNVFLHSFSTFFFWNEISHWTWCSWLWLDCLVIVPMGSACLHPPELSLWAHTAMPSFDIGAHDSGAHEMQVIFNKNIKWGRFCLRSQVRDSWEMGFVAPSTWPFSEGILFVNSSPWRLGHSLPVGDLRCVCTMTDGNWVQ